MNEKMSRLNIEAAVNGFIVNESHSHAMYADKPYVFESFPALILWLEKHLIRPDISDAQADKK